MYSGITMETKTPVRSICLTHIAYLEQQLNVNITVGLQRKVGHPNKKKDIEVICSVVSFMCNFHLEWSMTFFISYEYRKPQITAY